MGKLPEKFPEYSIMYKTISNKIKSLENQKKNHDNIEEINSKILKYQEEIDKIKNMFPDGFFEDN